MNTRQTLKAYIVAVAIVTAFVALMSCVMEVKMGGSHGQSYASFSRP